MNSPRTVNSSKLPHTWLVYCNARGGCTHSGAPHTHSSLRMFFSLRPKISLVVSSLGHSHTLSGARHSHLVFILVSVTDALKKYNVWEFGENPFRYQWASGWLSHCIVHYLKIAWSPDLKMTSRTWKILGKSLNLMRTMSCRPKQEQIGSQIHWHQRLSWLKLYAWGFTLVLSAKVWLCKTSFMLKWRYKKSLWCCY